MRRLACSLLSLGVALSVARARADVCDDKCAAARAALDDAQRRSARAGEELQVSEADVEAARREVARFETAIADAKRAKEAALDELAKPRAPGAPPPDAQKLAQTVKDADASMEDAGKKLSEARNALGAREQAARTLADAAARAQAGLDAAREARARCLSTCAAEAKAPPAPRAEQGVRASPSGLSVAVGAGAALPFGAVLEGSAMADRYAAKVPLGLEVGWRIDERITVGAYAEYGFVLRAAGACSGTSSCSSSEVRVGVDVEYRFVRPGLQPWVGAGIGYEVLSTSATLTTGGNESTSVEGVELLRLQGGADWRVTPRMAVGPFAAASTGMFLHGTEGAISGKRLHEWLTVGVRGRLDAL